MKKKYLLIVAIAVMTVCLGACGKQTETQENQTENTAIDEIKQEITSTTEDPQKNSKTELIIDNNNSKYVDENAETPNKKEGEDADDLTKEEVAEEPATYECAEGINVEIPEDYTVENDGANIMMIKDNIRICINMTETSLDKENRLQQKLAETVENPETPLEAANCGRYNDCARKNETYTILDHYISNNFDSNIYIIKMTSDIEDNDDEYDDNLPYCYYFVAEDVKTDGSMMVARTSDVQDDETAIELAKSIFK